MGANAQTSVPVFTAGQVLTAQQQTEINTGVPVFATTATRDAAFGGSGEKTLAEGQLAYIEASNIVQYYDGSAWATLAPTTSAVVQVKSTAKTDTFTTTSTSFTDVTGLTVSITPTSASNKIYVIASVAVGGAGSTQRGLRLARGGTGINVGDAGGSRTQAQWGSYGGQGANEVDGVIMAFLDSPATTSSTTYSVQAQTNDGNTVSVNRFGTEGGYNMSSSITVMEVTP